MKETKTVVGSIRLTVLLSDENGHALNKEKSYDLIDMKMIEAAERLKVKLIDKKYTSVEVESGLDRDDFSRLRRTIIATAYI